MKKNVLALLSGVLFGLGLAVSQMINPDKVLAFLDIAGDWDPSLALVLAASVLVTWLGFKLVLTRTQPVFEETFFLPTKKDLDAYLLMGSALFGVGWGIAGYCPGPAIAAITIGTWEPFIFVLSMLAGSFVCKFLPSA